VQADEALESCIDSIELLLLLVRVFSCSWESRNMENSTTLLLIVFINGEAKQLL